jgi:hypothetical protein
MTTEEDFDGVGSRYRWKKGTTFLDKLCPLPSKFLVVLILRQVTNRARFGEPQRNGNRMKRKGEKHKAHET